MPRGKRETDEVINPALEFIDPPGRRTRYNWESIANQLRAQPNEWALIFQGDRVSVVNAIRQGGIGPVHPGIGFQVRTANNVRGEIRTCDLYMRYVPPVSGSLRDVIKQSRG
jgi:hypothetical protein